MTHNITYECLYTMNCGESFILDFSNANTQIKLGKLSMRRMRLKKLQIISATHGITHIQSGKPTFITKRRGKIHTKDKFISAKIVTPNK